ncbi:hypothetical protein PSEUBRA_002992 [Kalmanozyma brasiliensis GHG001]|uniref:uncharacterized protein n=1 Tax=Kalmanozyma brasiliensis (strain GHG001) TaxID=1365824 RepID=UPI002867D412|nr:uncharacterized protein PSEUBRA_002992 [Kalmanozyma brasiliensis GHG001]KAF6767164.1 hypothetical protein PSEUBRA_002992 [Kalmanozyma brasiliensis GHG001]
MASQTNAENGRIRAIKIVRAAGADAQAANVKGESSTRRRSQIVDEISALHKHRSDLKSLKAKQDNVRVDAAAAESVLHAFNTDPVALRFRELKPEMFPPHLQQDLSMLQELDRNMLSLCAQHSLGLPTDGKLERVASRAQFDTLNMIMRITSHSPELQLHYLKRMRDGIKDDNRARKKD